MHIIISSHTLLYFWSIQDFFKIENSNYLIIAAICSSFKKCFKKDEVLQFILIYNILTCLSIKIFYIIEKIKFLTILNNVTIQT
jgi:hypothetical protein